MPDKIATPFLKWAGGKGQLIEQIKPFFPQALLAQQCTTYVEPFLGGGAMFFHLCRLFSFEQIVLNDVNPELILTYQTLQKDVRSLIDALAELEDRYLPLSVEERKDFFYSVRERFNVEKCRAGYSHYGAVVLAAKLIFLNKTCFNGLYRLNAKGGFNVPIGAYKNPTICDKANLLLCSKALQGVQLLSGDYEELSRFVDEKALVYIDPPYRPLSNTASFNSYQQSTFNDKEQIRLAKWFEQMAAEKQAHLILSNSDPKNADADDTFFDDLYAGFPIHRMQAVRSINSDAQKRGRVTEILVLSGL